MALLADLLSPRWRQRSASIFGRGLFWVLSAVGNVGVLNNALISIERHLFQIRIKNRELLSTLANKGVGTVCIIKTTWNILCTDQYLCATLQNFQPKAQPPLYADMGPEVAHDIGQKIAEIVAIKEKYLMKLLFLNKKFIGMIVDSFWSVKSSFWRSRNFETFNQTSVFFIFEENARGLHTQVGHEPNCFQ